MESIESTQNGVLQNTSGGTLSGDFPPKTKMFSAENTLKIHRKQYFATPRSFLHIAKNKTSKLQITL